MTSLAITANTVDEDGNIEEVEAEVMPTDVEATLDYDKALIKTKKEYCDLWDKEDPLAEQQAWLNKRGGHSLLGSPDVLQTIADCSPIETDMWDTLRFTRASRRRTILGESVRKAENQYAPFTPLAQHTWSALFNGEDPVIRDVVGPAPKWAAQHKELMEKLIEVPAYKRLAAKTKYKPISSSVALMSLTPTLLKLVKELEQQEEDKDDNDGDGNGGQGGQGGAEGTGNGPSMTPQQQQQLQQAVEAADKATDEAEGNMTGCGCEPPEDKDLDPDSYLPYLDKFDDNKIQRIMDEVGRLQKISLDTAKQNIPGFRGRGANRFYGDRLDLLPCDMYVNMVAEGLEDQFMVDLISGELPQCAEQDYAPPGKGPVVVCIDESGSMDGERLRMAKALAVASIRTARTHNRKSWAVSFASGSIDQGTRTYDTNGLAGMTGFMRSNLHGGTDFSIALQQARNVITNNFAAKQADILFLTDGECNIEQEFRASFQQWKKSKGVRVFVVSVGARSGYWGSDDIEKTFAGIADHCVKIDSLTNMADIRAGFGSFWKHLADSPLTYEEMEANDAEAEATAKKD